MDTTRKLLKDLLADTRGATAVEYGLIAGLIVIGLLVGLTNVAAANDATYEMIEEQLVV